MSTILDNFVLIYCVFAIIAANYIRYFTDILQDKRATFIWISIRAFVCSLLSLFFISFIWILLIDTERPDSIFALLLVVLIFGSAGIGALAIGILGDLRTKIRPKKKSKNRIEQENLHNEAMRLLGVAAEMNKAGRPKAEIKKIMAEADYLRKEGDRLDKIENEKYEREKLRRRLLIVVAIVLLAIVNILKT